MLALLPILEHQDLFGPSVRYPCLEASVNRRLTFRKRRLRIRNDGIRAVRKTSRSRAQAGYIHHPNPTVHKGATGISVDLSTYLGVACFHPSFY